MATDKNDAEAATPPPRQTYMPKPPSKEEVDMVSREQAMVTDDWTGEPAANGGAESGAPPKGEDQG